MNQKKKNTMTIWTDLMRNLAMMTQLGLSFITPLLLCLAAAYLLMTRFSLGGWVFLPAFFFGMGGSAMVAYKFYRATVLKETRQAKENKTISYNRHL